MQNTKNFVTERPNRVFLHSTPYKISLGYGYHFVLTGPQTFQFIVVR